MTRQRLLGDSRWVPLLPQPRLPRADLVRRLGGTPPGGVAVIVSPVGYGASSLLALAAESSGGPVVWLSGRGNAGSAQSMSRQLAEGLDSVGLPESDVLTDIADDPELMRRAVAGLLSAAWGAPDFLLVVDDLPRDEAVEAMIQQVLDELPASMRVMISSGSVPRLDLSRLSGAGQLVLLERADLVLRREESEEYLRLVAPHLPAGRRASLMALADGWIAALRASTSATEFDPGADPASWLLGPGLEVLFGRGLQGLDPLDRDLLVLSSVLDQMSPEVCDAVTGDSDGAQRLAALSDRLLIARVSGPGPARYETHPLFREYLGRKLSERGRGSQARAHEAAGVWLSESGDAEAAISHLLEGGRIESAREVLSAHVRDLLDAGRSEQVRTWYRRAPELTLPDHQLLLLAAAWSELLAGDVAAAGPHLVELEAAPGTLSPCAPDVENAAATAADWLRIQVLFLRSYLEAWTGQTSLATEHLRTVRATFGHEWSRMAHQAAALLEARLAWWHGDPKSTRRILLQQSGRPGTLQFNRQVAIPSLGALIAAEEGRAHRACFLADSALDALAKSGKLSAVDVCDARLARARALGDLGQTAQAEAEAEAVQGTAAQVEHVPFMVLGAVQRARVLAAGGHRAAADEQLESTRADMTRRSIRGPLGEAVDRARAEVAILSGDRQEARRAVERLEQGRSRDLLAMRVLSMGGRTSEADAVRIIQATRPESPREVVDARLAMAACTAASRRSEAEMHLRAAAAVAHEHGMILALLGRCEKILVLAGQLASQGGDAAVDALVGALPPPVDTEGPAGVALSAGEHQLLERLAAFPTNRELSEDLGITMNTLKTRLRRLYAKLGVHDREAALHAGRPRS